MRELFWLCYGCLALAWPSAVLAAQTAGFGSAMRQIDFLGLFIAVVLASLSGLTSLLNQMRREYRDGNKIEQIWLFVGSKMLGSNLAGLIVFFYAPEQESLTPGNIAVLIIVAAFGGTWFVERLLQALVATLTKGKAE